MQLYRQNNKVCYIGHFSNKDLQELLEIKPNNRLVVHLIIPKESHYCSEENQRHIIEYIRTMIRRKNLRLCIYAGYKLQMVESVLEKYYPDVMYDIQSRVYIRYFLASHTLTYRSELVLSVTCNDTDIVIAYEALTSSASFHVSIYRGRLLVSNMTFWYR